MGFQLHRETGHAVGAEHLQRHDDPIIHWHVAIIAHLDGDGALLTHLAAGGDHIKDGDGQGPGLLDVEVTADPETVVPQEILFPHDAAFHPPTQCQPTAGVGGVKVAEDGHVAALARWKGPLDLTGVVFAACMTVADLEVGVGGRQGRVLPHHADPDIGCLLQAAVVDHHLHRDGGVGPDAEYERVVGHGDPCGRDGQVVGQSVSLDDGQSSDAPSPVLQVRGVRPVRRGGCGGDETQPHRLAAQVEGGSVHGGPHEGDAVRRPGRPAVERGTTRYRDVPIQRPVGGLLALRPPPGILTVNETTGEDIPHPVVSHTRGILVELPQRIAGVQNPRGCLGREPTGGREGPTVLPRGGLFVPCLGVHMEHVTDADAALRRRDNYITKTDKTGDVPIFNRHFRAVLVGKEDGGVLRIQWDGDRGAPEGVFELGETGRDRTKEVPGVW